jgi:hypothetical protein
MSVGTVCFWHLASFTALVARLDARGAQPVDLPVQYPTKFQLVVNVKRAKTIPESFLVRADKVVE